ncbi:MAG: oxidoreductase [Cyanobacteriota bacterium]
MPAPTRWTAEDIPDQNGKVVLITGANSGLGLETARALLSRGATVILGCRSRARAEAARQELLSSGAAIDRLDLDLASLSSVAAAAEWMARHYGRLDLLINNAGVMAPPRTLTRDGFELQFGINHLGHHLLTSRLLPLMQGQQDPRIVMVTSGAQYFGRIAFDDLQGERRYDRWRAYGQSKLANVMLALEWQERLEAVASTVRAMAAHPGVARTNLQPTSIALNGSRLEPLVYRLLDPLFQSAAMGALPQLYAATSPEASGGGHYGPSQFGGLKGWPVPAPVAPAARDRQSRQRLWQVSAELCAAAGHPLDPEPA